MRWDTQRRRRMLDWLKKLGGAKGFENKVGFESKAVSLLAEDLSALDKLNSELPPKLLRYVLDNEGGEVLAQLAGTQGAGEALGLMGSVFSRRQEDSARTRFFD